MRRRMPALPVVCILWALVASLASASAFGLGDSITYCPFDQLTCQNGGVLNSTSCQASIPCQIPPLSNWYSEVNCTCPPGYIGTDCQLVATPGAICGTNTTFDVTYFNTSVAQKHIECFIHSQYLPLNITLRSHRISVDLTTNNVGLGNIKFVLSSRHTDGRSSPAQCSIQQVDLECDFQGCQGSSPSNGDQYICQKGSCESCASYNGSYCDPYWLTVAQSVTMPATILFDMQDPSRGFARLSLFGAGGTNPLLTSACTTGACVILDQFVPSNNSNWLIIVVICSAAGVLGVCLGGACMLNRRAKGDEVVDDLSDPDAVSAPATQRSGQVVYPFSASRSVSKLSDIMAAHHNDLPKFGVVFDVITYDVTLRARFWQTAVERRILHGVTGVVRPGQLVAIMGSSGAGKSSLMNIISQRVQTGRIGGDIALISDTMRAKRISHVVSYVLQDDRLMTTQTVREAMLFSARMRLPPKFTESMIRAKVNRMIRQLRLEKVADSRIGGIDEGGGISGGERKRLAIGIELLADPRILLLDEPTSGLDSVSAHVVMKVLRSAAENGCACILSIHQPPAKVFNMFDSVLLLTRLGEQAFFGSPNAALNHMHEIGYPEADQWVNPAEYLLDIASQESVDALKRLPRAFYSSRHYAVLSQMIENVKRNNIQTQVALSDDDDLQTPLMSPASGRVRRRSLLQELMGDKFESPRPTAAGAAASENSPLPPGDRLSRQSSGNALFGSSLPEPPLGSVLAQSEDAMISISAIEEPAPRMTLPLPLPSVGGFASPAVDSGRSSASAAAANIAASAADLPVFRRKQASKFQKFAMLSWRTFLNNYRDPSLLGVQVIVTLVMAWLIAGVYWHLDIFMPGIQNRAGGLFFIVLYFILVSMSSLGALAEERVLFQRERSSDFYTTMPYFMSKLVCDFIPLRVIPPLIFGVIVYKFMWLHAGATQFMLFIVIIVLVNLTATSACFFLSAVIHDPGEVNLAASLFFIYCLLYGGLLLNNDTGGSKLVALKYGSFYHYAWEALMINEFTDLTVVFNPEGFGNTILNGDVVLSNFALDQDSFFLDIYVLLAFCVFFLFGAYMFLLPDKPHVQWVGHDPFVVSRYLSEAKADAAAVAAVELPTPPSHKRTIRQSSASALPID